MQPTRKARSVQQAAVELMARASKHGVEKKPFVELTDLLLTLLGKKAAADTFAGDKILRKGQRLTLALVEMGIKTPADLRAFWNWYKSRYSWQKNLPNFDQTLDYASKYVSEKHHHTTTGESRHAASDSTGLPRISQAEWERGQAEARERQKHLPF